MNPYESPRTKPERSEEGGRPARDPGVLVIMALLVVAAAGGMIALFVPVLNAFAMPRFGWGGLVLCLNPLIFLFIWYKTPQPRNLAIAAAMCGVVGVLNAAQLIARGTVGTVQNVFNDRLHSSWVWCVLSLLLAAGYLGWSAFMTARRSHTT